VPGGHSCKVGTDPNRDAANLLVRVTVEDAERCGVTPKPPPSQDDN